MDLLLLGGVLPRALLAYLRCLTRRCIRSDLTCCRLRRDLLAYLRLRSSLLRLLGPFLRSLLVASILLLSGPILAGQSEWVWSAGTQRRSSVGGG